MSLTATPDARAADVTLAPLTRNPTIPLIDRRDALPARSFKSHREFAFAAASGLSGGAMFTLIQPAKRGFWITEWTVVSESAGRIARRRAALGKTLEAAVAEFVVRPSFHNSHYFRPEEGLLGAYRRA